MTEDTIIIGTPDGDHLRLNVVGWLHERPENDFDAGWLSGSVEVVASPFQGSISLDLRIEDLLGLQSNLKRLYDDFRAGEATFSPTFGTPVDFVVRIAHTGQIVCEGSAIGNMGEENEQRMDFRIAVSGTLQDLLRMVDTVVASLPVRDGVP